MRRPSLQKRVHQRRWETPRQATVTVPSKSGTQVRGFHGLFRCHATPAVVHPDNVASFTPAAATWDPTIDLPLPMSRLRLSNHTACKVRTPAEYEKRKKGRRKKGRARNAISP